MERAPTLSLKVHPIRDYAFTLEQTKIVYDNLLADKFDKLMGDIYEKKTEFDENANELLKRDQEKAMEYGVKAQAALNKMHQEASVEIQVLQKDYQQKLNKMLQTYEEKWRKEHISRVNRTH